MRPLDKRSICLFPAKPSQAYNPNQTYHIPTELSSLCATSHPRCQKQKVSRLSRSSGQKQLVEELHSVLGAGDGVTDNSGVGKDLIIVTALVRLSIHDMLV